MKKLKDLIQKHASVFISLILILIWQLVASLKLVPAFMLPSPVNVIKAFISDFQILMSNAAITILEALIGFLLATLVGLILAIIMDNSSFFERSISPILLFTQTVPPIALAPLLILWFGYGMADQNVTSRTHTL